MKLQRELNGLKELLSESAVDIMNSGSFQNIAVALARTAAEKKYFADLVAKDQASQHALKMLRARQKNLKSQTEQTVKEKDLQVRAFRDSLQALKTHSGNEVKYVQKETAMKVAMTRKRIGNDTTTLSKEDVEMQRQIVEEAKVNVAVEEFLKENMKSLGVDMEKWLGKIERDVEKQQLLLVQLKDDRARDLMKLKDLTEKYGGYEEVVEDYRKKKAKQNILAMQSILELAAAIRLQSWWRGIIAYIYIYIYIYLYLYISFFMLSLNICIFEKVFCSLTI